MSGSVTVETEIEGPEQRRSRRERPEREMSVAEIDPVTIEDEGGAFSPEDAAADAARKLRDSQARVETERSGRLQAEQAAAQARNAAQLAHAGRARDRAAAVAATVEAAKSEAELAESAFVSARETGDAVAEARALRAMSAADFRLNQATGELAAIQAGGGDQPQANQQPRRQPRGPGPAVQEWIARNPRFNTDNAFKQAALAAHAEAVTDGIVAESPAYFRHIESRLAEQFGQDGQSQERQQRMEEPRTPQRREQFSGAPPSRGDGNGASRANTVQTLLGPVTVNRLANGTIGIQIPQALRENFEEGARISEMTLAEYAHDQVKVAEERKSGGNGGMIESETQTWR
jgi:hypothetical protein